VAAAQRQGTGTTVVATLPESYAWQLQSAAGTYESYWSRLLSAAARPAAASAHWTINNAWPRPNLPVALQLSATSMPPQMLRVRSSQGETQALLPLRQDTRLPEWSTTTYWPKQSGWQQAHLPGAQPAQWFYVFGSTDWLGPELSQRTQAAAVWAASGAAPRRTHQVGEPWPAGWFFALFLLAAGFLWLEEKL
jgi:hypothetical protein